ncbi:hypothetical protein [Sporanaerobacter acetigenes]|uniref:SipL SPOCS domain-containing protein n=1 Tax=Sporanaerobacter acetigenes DSM 13106 TaxID=1123281 RepID=A0A1M5UE96_9FIRM|nr:hypothetical protein [Sporanaerobacter acetigenes]SHH61156.1 hypothetical protein SAMN02745180_00609 [Sporanaerobacter acetigenes DSM 13106]
MNEFKKVINGIDTNEMEYEFDCIIADKVYDSCQQRHCFPKIEADLGGKTFQAIRFKPGFIVPNTLIVTDIENQPNFKRVRFTLRIPYEIIFTDGTSVEKFLPDILKDTKLFIPDARDEFTFDIVVETSSKVLGTPIVASGKVSFAVGVFIITKVVGKVQLLIPVIDFCPEPRECEEFGDICEDFEYEPFPDFFPPQLEE